ncbi:predicted protein [Naegleria gruberi]|uniref:Predicted protein n=1 Tax=Naegleria gruberi TaxID=5762 RepID=D2VLZ2_NAEGR|nr:uncharacterized protein NAEGRDRAFT_69952 [Naegleria gruberi]EFC42227.1 predicted protein [Naegleria gruberi]|eukprot:XP_002674971.1 predicted protein [Naegleria gruberi strain NEG-M]
MFGLSIIPAFSFLQQVITSSRKQQSEIVDDLHDLVQNRMKQWEKRLMEAEMNDRDDEYDDGPSTPGMYGLLPGDGTSTNENVMVTTARDRKFISIYEELETLLLQIKAKSNELNASIKNNGVDENVVERILPILRSTMLISLNRSTFMGSCPSSDLKWNLGFILESSHYACLESLISLSENKDLHLNVLKSGKDLSDEITIGDGNNEKYTQIVKEICTNGTLGTIFNSILYEGSAAIQAKARRLLDVVSADNISHESLMHRLDTFRLIVETRERENEMISALVISRMYSNPNLFKTLTLHQNLPFINMLQNMYSNSPYADVKKLSSIGLMISKGKTTEYIFLREEENSMKLWSCVESAKKLGIFATFGLMFRSSYFLYNTRLLSSIPFFIFLPTVLGEVLDIERMLTEGRQTHGWLHVGTTAAISLMLSRLKTTTLSLVMAPYLAVYFMSGLSLDSGKLPHQRHHEAIASNLFHLDSLAFEHSMKRLNRFLNH